MSFRPRFEPYKHALQAASQRTGTPLPSLLFSFAVLHEITAVVPVVTMFCACRALGAGDAVVKYLKNNDEASTAEGVRGEVLAKASKYLEEGELTAARFAKRYGLWGADGIDTTKGNETYNIAGDMADAAVAYGVTKVRIGGVGNNSQVMLILQALLPLRIAASIYLAPWFSRRAIEPTRLVINDFVSRFRKAR